MCDCAKDDDEYQKKEKEKEEEREDEEEKEEETVKKEKKKAPPHDTDLERASDAPIAQPDLSTFDPFDSENIQKDSQRWFGLTSFPFASTSTADNARDRDEFDPFSPVVPTEVRQEKKEKEEKVKKRETFKKEKKKAPPHDTDLEPASDAPIAPTDFNTFDPFASQNIQKDSQRWFGFTSFPSASTSTADNARDRNEFDPFSPVVPTEVRQEKKEKEEKVKKRERVKKEKKKAPPHDTDLEPASDAPIAPTDFNTFDPFASENIQKDSQRWFGFTSFPSTSISTADNFRDRDEFDPFSPVVPTEVHQVGWLDIIPYRFITKSSKATSKNIDDDDSYSAAKATVHKTKTDSAEATTTPDYASAPMDRDRDRKKGPIVSSSLGGPFFSSGTTSSSDAKRSTAGVSTVAGGSTAAGVSAAAGVITAPTSKADQPIWGDRTDAIDWSKILPYIAETIFVICTIQLLYKNRNAISDKLSSVTDMLSNFKGLFNVKSFGTIGGFSLGGFSSFTNFGNWKEISMRPFKSITHIGDFIGRVGIWSTEGSGTLNGTRTWSWSRSETTGAASTLESGSSGGTKSWGWGRGASTTGTGGTTTSGDTGTSSGTRTSSWSRSETTGAASAVDSGSSGGTRSWGWGRGASTTGTAAGTTTSGDTGTTSGTRTSSWSRSETTGAASAVDSGSSGGTRFWGWGRGASTTGTGSTTTGGDTGTSSGTRTSSWSRSETTGAASAVDSESSGGTRSWGWGKGASTTTGTGGTTASGDSETSSGTKTSSWKNSDATSTSKTDDSATSDGTSTWGWGRRTSTSGTGGTINEDSGTSSVTNTNGWNHSKATGTSSTGGNQASDRSKTWDWGGRAGSASGTENTGDDAASRQTGVWIWGPPGTTTLGDSGKTTTQDFGKTSDTFDKSSSRTHVTKESEKSRIENNSESSDFLRLSHTETGSTNAGGIANSADSKTTTDTKTMGWGGIDSKSGATPDYKETLDGSKTRGSSDLHDFADFDTNSAQSTENITSTRITTKSAGATDLVAGVRNEMHKAGETEKINDVEGTDTDTHKIKLRATKKKNEPEWEPFDANMKPILERSDSVRQADSSSKSDRVSITNAAAKLGYTRQKGNKTPKDTHVTGTLERTKPQGGLSKDPAGWVSAVDGQSRTTGQPQKVGKPGRIQKVDLTQKERKASKPDVTDSSKSARENRKKSIEWQETTKNVTNGERKGNSERLKGTKRIATDTEWKKGPQMSSNSEWKDSKARPGSAESRGKTRVLRISETEVPKESLGSSWKEWNEEADVKVGGAGSQDNFRRPDGTESNESPEKASGVKWKDTTGTIGETEWKKVPQMSSNSEWKESKAKLGSAELRSKTRVLRKSETEIKKEALGLGGAEWKNASTIRGVTDWKDRTGKPGMVQWRDKTQTTGTSKKTELLRRVIEWGKIRRMGVSREVLVRSAQFKDLSSSEECTGSGKARRETTNRCESNANETVLSSASPGFSKDKYIDEPCILDCKRKWSLVEIDKTQ